jgi:hypothetical protein
MKTPVEEATVSVVVSTIMWALLISVSFALTYYAAYVLRVLWDWFVVPEGYKPLSISLSVGILLISQLIRAKMDTSTQTDDKPAYYRGFHQLAFFAVYFTLALVSAAIWKFWLL